MVQPVQGWLQVYVPWLPVLDKEIHVQSWSWQSMQAVGHAGGRS